MHNICIIRSPNNVTLHHHNRHTANDTNSIPVAGIASLLDIDPAYMEENFSAMLYAKHYSSNNESWDAELAHKFTGTPNPGFWFNKGVFDEESQQESAELTHGEWLGTAENICFIVSLACDSQSETVNTFPSAISITV